VVQKWVRPINFPILPFSPLIAYFLSLNDGWQLVIIDSSTKQHAVQKAFLSAGGTHDDAAWIGFTNRDGWGSNSANGYETLDIYGNRAKYLNYKTGEPDNKRGNPNDERGEDCVRLVRSWFEHRKNIEKNNTKIFRKYENF